MSDGVDGYIPLHPKTRGWLFIMESCKTCSVVLTSNLFPPVHIPLGKKKKAEATVQVFKVTLYNLCDQVGTSPEFKQVTVRKL